MFVVRGEALGGAQLTVEVAVPLALLLWTEPERARQQRQLVQPPPARAAHGPLKRFARRLLQLTGHRLRGDVLAETGLSHFRVGASGCDSRTTFCTCG